MPPSKKRLEYKPPSQPNKYEPNTLNKPTSAKAVLPTLGSMPQMSR